MVVEIAKLQYLVSDGRSGEVNAAETLTVCRGSTVSFLAVNQLGDSTFPEDCPEWSGTSGITGTGNPKDVAFNTTSQTLADLKTVTAHCGVSITASVLVVEVDRIEPPTLTACLDDLVTFTAIAKPANAAFPPDCPTWGGTALVSGTGATVTFPAVELGEFSVTATCGRTVSAALTVISGPPGPHASGDFSVDASGEDCDITGQPWVATKYYYSDNLPLPTVAFDYSVKRYIPGVDHRGLLPNEGFGLIAPRVISSTARLRLWADDGLGPRIVFNPHIWGTRVTLAPDRRLNGMCGRAVFEYTIDTYYVRFPAKRGTTGVPPVGAVNTVESLEGSVYAYEFSFDAMSPYILIHGKGALGTGATGSSTGPSFWRGQNPDGKRCWRGLANEFDVWNIPYDDSISLSYFPPDDISQRSIADQARELNDKPLSIAREFGTTHANFIDHSKGGLDTREWLVGVKPRAAPSLIVGQVITLDTPHLGSVIADYAVAGSSLTVAEVSENTGIQLQQDWIALSPIGLVRILWKILYQPHPAAPVKYPALIIGPKIAKMKRDAGLGGVDPQSPATVDLQVSNATIWSYRNFPLLQTYNGNPDGTIPTFLATRGDADLNSNRSISFGEKHYAMRYDLVTGFFADQAYYGLRDFRTVNLLGPVGSRIVNEQGTFQKELNDFLVAYSSAWPVAQPPNVFQPCGVYKRDHGTIADDGMARRLILSNYIMPRSR